MKTAKSFLIFFLVVFPLFTFCQEEPVSVSSNNEETNFKVRPFRFESKLGFPNISGLGTEYVTPLFNDRLAVAAQLSKFKSSWFQSDDSNDDKLDFSYISGGLNYYLFKPGKGLYGGLSYGSLKVKGEIVMEGDDDNVPGKQYFDISNNSFNLKIGAKWGGLFYVRPEIGYSLNPIPDSIESVIIYNDGTRENESYDFGDNGFLKLLSSGLIFSIGTGFAF
ncbi:hypothetical protein [Gramella sp. AN32]|uniref:Outer membrane protein beta-barrel domain-containing protein n=1 Tax=Christiangramia antarctica TaxID=2058158 RepID=A0ABW5X0P9_9FLAO|nr:hypothetical protein [Gramella sp. AN32]MCM4157069.1 hypothetical protein [Gramella sp. AN32]